MRGKALRTRIRKLRSYAVPKFFRNIQRACRNPAREESTVEEELFHFPTVVSQSLFLGEPILKTRKGYPGNV